MSIPITKEVIHVEEFRLEPSPATDPVLPCSVCGGQYQNHDGCQLFLLGIKAEQEDLNQLALFEKGV